MKFIPYIVMALITFAFAAAGIAKLMGVPAVHKSFADMGLPVAFGYFIGLCELAGAVGIWLRKTSRLAAMGLAVIMVGALFYHVSYPPVAAGIPALVLLGLNAYVISRIGTGVIG